MLIFTRKQIIFFALLFCAVAGYWYFSDNKRTSKSTYKIRAVERGDIIQTISANGTVTPVVVVNVGTQVSGTVLRLFADHNDQVQTNQILAELDPALLKAQFQQAKANLNNAHVGLRMAESKLKRQRLLNQQGFISPEALEIAEQEVEAARAQVSINKAQVTRDEANLNYTVIRSPISGVVIARDVDIGQTVAASFQTPTLFKIAKDLRQMQINISVAEADIGQLHVDQVIQFTVDAFPNRKFKGLVKQVRLNPTIQENVVTYNVVAMVDNEDGTLLPGMTANIHFVVTQRKEVLRVPNAALRFQPKGSEEAEKSNKPTSSNSSRVYRLMQEQAEAVSITTGITDGNFTEIISGEIAEGDSIIISEIVDKKEAESKFKLRVFLMTSIAMNNSIDSLIRIEHLGKSYSLQDAHGQTITNPVLFDVNLSIRYGEFVAIMGQSGSGKSTLMNILGCLDTPSEGSYWLAGEDISTLSNDQLAHIRNQRIGFVFQGFNLLKRMTALDNVAMPLLYAGIHRAQSRKLALEQLCRTGLEKFSQHQPNQLSGGQQQRVAISRALINNPPLILADEPTGNLDSQTSQEIMQLFQKLNQEQGMTIVLVTHEDDIAAYAKRLIILKDGRVIVDKNNI